MKTPIYNPPTYKPPTYNPPTYKPPTTPSVVPPYNPSTSIVPPTRIKINKQKHKND